jgi:hypothetical protein
VETHFIAIEYFNAADRRQTIAERGGERALAGAGESGEPHDESAGCS